MFTGVLSPFPPLVSARFFFLREFVIKILEFHFSFSFRPRRRFVFQTKMSGKFVEIYFLFYSFVYLFVDLPSLYLALMLLIYRSRSSTESSIPAPLNQSRLSLWSCCYLIIIIKTTQ